VAHDSRIIPYVDRVFYLEDGAFREPDGSEIASREAEVPTRLPGVF
jgi:hypothetical protein